MDDMMMFPKTVDEFMDEYKIVDTDEVYTNGAELVPIFRMKQWFEHIDAEPVKHGYWIVVDDPCSLMWRCSVCGETCCYDNYCGNCGAKMDEEDEDVKTD